MTEKIIAAHSGRSNVRPGEILDVDVDILMIHDFFLWPQHIQALDELGVERIWDPEKVAIVFDHAVPAFTAGWAKKHERARQWLRSQGIEKFWDVGQGGVSHQIASEVGLVWPGMVFVNSDPQVTLNGAFGALAVSFNSLEVMVTGKGWCRVPETVRVELQGELPAGVTGRDVFLATVAAVGIDDCIYRMLEFAGPGVRSLSVDDRMTLCDLVAIAGSKSAIIEADEATTDYLQFRVERPYEIVRSDPDAEYHKVVDLHLDRVEPMVVSPPDPLNAQPLTEMLGRPVNVGFIGSCAGARMEQLRVVARILEQRPVASGFRLIIQPPSKELQLQMAEEGLTEVFMRAGAMIEPPGCGMCWGGGANLAAGEVCIASGTMNNPGRMGSTSSEVYLANEAICAATAVEGRIADPRAYDLEASVV